jgi:hypothetical protein
MKKNILESYSLVTIISLVLAACASDEKKAEIIRPEPKSLSFVEEFDDVSAMSGKGWVIVNSSEPAGPSGWRQGKYEVRFDSKNGQVVDGFPAFSSQKAQTDFVSVDLNAGSDVATLSAWLISAPIAIKNGDVLSFYARSHGDFADRMQVRANLANQSTNVGKGANAVGDFSTLWLDVNPNLTATGFPVNWTKYTITVSGLATGALINARIGFRYFVPNGGPSGANSDMIGLDQLKFESK